MSAANKYNLVSITTLLMCVGLDGGVQNTAHNAEKPRPLMTNDELEQAACRHLPKNMFYPELPHQLPLGQRICAQCPVSAQCAQEGQHERYGIWGGLTPKDRGFGRQQ